MKKYAPVVEERVEIVRGNYVGGVEEGG